MKVGGADIFSFWGVNLLMRFPMSTYVSLMVVYGLFPTCKVVHVDEG